jgi:hypothetical protein
MGGDVPKLRDEMIAKGLIQPQEAFRERASVLERRHEEASVRLANHRENERVNKESDTGRVTSTPMPAKRKPTRHAKLVQVPIELKIEDIRKETEAKTRPLTLGLPLTQREKLLLRRLASGNLTHEEREKAQRSYNASRQLQESLWKKAEKKRLARKASEASNKKKRLKNKMWISLPSKGSSMFGGVKYSFVSVWQGGLPGLGKRK